MRDGKGEMSRRHVYETYEDAAATAEAAVAILGRPSDVSSLCNLNTNLVDIVRSIAVNSFVSRTQCLSNI